MSDVATVKVPTTLRGTLIEGVRVLRDPPLFLWFLYIMLFPVYVFRSGVPQPGDMLVLLMVPVTLRSWNGRLPRALSRPLRPLMMFMAYVIVSALVWAAIDGTMSLSAKDGYLMTPTYYIYNALVFLVVIVLYRRYAGRFVWLTLNAVLLSALTQVAISFVFTRGSTGRGAVLFNNPNQLGFYALLSASIMALGRRRLGLGTVASTVGLLACGFLALLSASKAALAGTGLLVIIGLVTNPRTILLASAAFVVLLSVADPVGEAYDRASTRVNATTQYGLLTDRGYERILDHKEYWILGSGEGDYKRFEETTLIGDHEMHSSAGTLFFCYGIVGTAIFAAFVLAAIRGARFRTTMLLFPAGAYGLSHQGLRFTLFWVLLALFACVTELERRRTSGAR